MNFTSSSSHVSSASYDPDKKKLSVTFKNGSTYHYHDVDQSSYENFKNAKSHGEHLTNNIKNKFRFTKE